MSTDYSGHVIPLDEIEIPQLDEFPATQSVALHGPPGTGKTTTAGGRVGLLIQDHGYEIEDIAWGTYRRSLANDTLRRLAGWDLVPVEELAEPTKGATRYISTLHAIGNRLVGDLSNPATVGDRKDFCYRLNIRYWGAEKWERSTPGKLLFSVFDWLNNNRKDPADMRDVVTCPFYGDLDSVWDGHVPKAWQAWQEYKNEREVCDFHEMLSEPLERGIRPPCPILVIDEFHDATALMAELAESWIDGAEIAIVCGDPHQVVNAYEGTDPRFFEQLNLPRVQLGKSHRVGEEHWAIGRSLLANAHTPPSIERTGVGSTYEYRSPSFSYSSGREQGSRWSVSDEKTEASPAWFVDEFPNGTTLFLARTRRQCAGIGAALAEAGIIFHAQKHLGGWNDEGGETRLNLYNGLQRIRGFSPDHFEGYQQGLTPYMMGTAGRDPRDIDLRADEAAALLDHASVQDYGHLDQSRINTDDIAERIRTAEQPISLPEFNKWVTRQFWTHLTAGERSERFLIANGRSEDGRRRLRAALDRNNDPLDPLDPVPVEVLTIHGAKGYEADDVVVYDGVTRAISRSIHEDESDRNNEWRTWYVACTRAAERLHIVRSGTQDSPGGFRWMERYLPDDVVARARNWRTEAAAYGEEVS